MLEFGRFRKCRFSRLAMSPVSARGSGDLPEEFLQGAKPLRRWRLAASGE
jgi:hypothetical protein